MVFRSLCLFLTLGVSVVFAHATDGRPPNFVILLVDDLGWADTSVYGSDLHKTPNIDRLASQSVRFTDAYAASPVCTPTRASIMTGKYPARLDMTVWSEASADPPRDRKLIPPIVRGDLPHAEVTIAEVLHEAGYFTAHIGKWHLGTAPFYPETQGFDLNIGGTLWGAPQSFFWPYRGNRYFGHEPRYVPGLEGGKPGEYLTDRLTQEAIEVLDRVGDRPFFLNVCYHTVHTPIEAKDEAIKRYSRKTGPDLYHKNAAYAAMVSSLDESVGRILAGLEERRLAENTVVIFASDNGGFVNRWQGEQVTNNHPLRSGKGSLYEGGIRVPLLVRWPGVTHPGSVCHEPVCSTDFYPTILDIADLEGDTAHNAAVDGLSLVPLFRDSSVRLNRDILYFHYPHYYATTSPVSALRARDWKLLHYYEDDHLELYNLAEDPGESRNLVSRYPDRVLRLRRALDNWRESVAAPEPQPH